MAFLRRLLGRSSDNPGSSGDDAPGGLDGGDGVDVFAHLHRVTVWLRLIDPELQNELEEARMFALEDRIMRRLYESGAGEHESNDLGSGFLAIRLVGPDADAIVAAVQPLLVDLQRGSYLAVRRGPAGTAEERVEPGPATGGSP
jgi:hypothetical protein